MSTKFCESVSYFHCECEKCIYIYMYVDVDVPGVLWLLRCLLPDMRAMYSCWYSSWFFPFFALKSSSCVKASFFSISLLSAGGYWPTQYHEPGASQIRFSEEEIHALLFLDTLFTLKKVPKFSKVPLVVGWTVCKVTDKCYIIIITEESRTSRKSSVSCWVGRV